MGNLGHFLTVLGFVAGLLSTFAFFYAIKHQENNDWKNVGRFGFLLQSFTIFAVIGLLFYILTGKFYEYQYAQAHVSDDLQMRYIFSAFWEGQEGSFLLWMFWHAVLGIILLVRNDRWSNGALAVLSIAQCFLYSMILGIYFTEEYKLGSSPFLLLRDLIDAPVFAQPDYLEQIKGTGLNPLLQNYWMTIHPPTLFLGFASTIIPFCYALAALIQNEHKAWLSAVLPWALFSGAILGLGILMGGAWAYEALTFGGYWAWDPVENMSLVPWLLMIAGLHTNAIAKSTGHSIRATYLFYILSFVLILYSSFMTRSGVLGDTSVHAFTEMGLESQLVALVVFFLLFGLALFFWRFNNIPAPVKEESTSSKEFWMFIGALVLLFSAGLITVSTSLPVYNKVREFFDPTYVGAVIADQVEHHNRFQLWIGVLIGLLSGGAQYLRWREANFRGHAKSTFLRIGAAVILSAAVTYLTLTKLNAEAWQYQLLLFACWFTVITNIDYLISQTRGNWRLASSALSHIGFGVMIIGSLFAGLNKHYISSNPFAMDGLIDGATAEDLKKNIILIRDIPMFMGEYEVTYVHDTLDGVTRTFTVDYKRRDEAGNVTEEFSLSPNVLYNKEFSSISASNPDTKHYLGRDVFTHIPSLPSKDYSIDSARAIEERTEYAEYLVGLQDTVFGKALFTTIQSVDFTPDHPDYKPEEGDLAVGYTMILGDLDNDTLYTARPMAVLRGNFVYWFPDQVNNLKAKVKVSETIFQKVLPPDDQLDFTNLNLKQGETIAYKDYTLTFKGFNREPKHPEYRAEEEDIVVGAVLEVKKNGTSLGEVQPIYLIRDSRPYNLEDRLLSQGLHFRFANLDPDKEQIEIGVAENTWMTEKLPFELAEDVSRDDWIVLEAIIFPGINLFWAGSLLMLLGLTIAMFGRRKQRSNA